MGDVAMIVPVLKALTSQYPVLKITVVSRPFFKPFFENITNVNFFGIDVNQRHKGFLGLLKHFSDLKNLNIDAVADLHNVIRSKAIRKLFILFGKKVAASNKGRTEKKALTQAKNKVFKPLKTMFEVHCDTFAKLGFKINLNNPSFPEKANLTDKVTSIIGNNNKTLIGIAPFAQYESKVYPQDLMQEESDYLSQSVENIKLEVEIPLDKKITNKISDWLQNIISE